MTMPRACPPALPTGRQLPLPLEPPAAPPTLPPRHAWAGLSPPMQAQVRAAFVLVVREVLHAADRR
jgi:hypothetical protein